jgi:hypothetical protein
LGIYYHEKVTLYTIPICHQPPLAIIPFISYKLINILHPKNLIILTSSNSVPSTIPISQLITSTPRMAIGGIPIPSNPLFSNRGRVTRDTIQARITAHQHPDQSEIPILQTPYMIQGISASLICLAEIKGIHAVCYIVSCRIESPDRRDIEKLVSKVKDQLGGIELNVNDILKGWRTVFGISGYEKMSIYL